MSRVCFYESDFVLYAKFCSRVCSSRTTSTCWPNALSAVIILVHVRDKLERGRALSVPIR